MRLAHSGDRHPGPRQPRNGNRIWPVTSVVTVLIVVFVAVKLTGSGCPALPRAAGSAAAAGAGGPGRGAAGEPRAASPLAARPAWARSAIEGMAVFYDPGQAAGSCGLGPFPAGGWYASLPPRRYGSGRACGSYVDVHGPAGMVRAEVVDVCPDCAAGTVDLSRAAFAQIADLDSGTVTVSYQAAVDPPLPGPLVLRLDAAGRPGTLAVQVLNHGNRLLSVDASRAGGRWQRLVPDPDGYWTGPLRPGQAAASTTPGGTTSAVAGGVTGAVAGGVTGAVAARAAGTSIRVRITDVAGHQVVLTGMTLRRTVQHATAWMYRARSRTAPQATVAPRSPAGRASRATSGGSC